MLNKQISYIILLLGAGLILSTSPANAQSNRHINKLRIQKQVEEIEEKIAQIPIYKEKLDGNYQIVGPVYGQDAFTKKKDAIIKHMRILAYKMEADAIMEFKCKTPKLKLTQTCEGFAIRYTEPQATND